MYLIIKGNARLFQDLLGNGLFDLRSIPFYVGKQFLRKHGDKDEATQSLIGQKIVASEFRKQTSRYHTITARLNFPGTIDVEKFEHLTKFKILNQANPNTDIALTLMGDLNEASLAVDGNDKPFIDYPVFDENVSINDGDATQGFTFPEGFETTQGESHEFA